MSENRYTLHWNSWYWLRRQIYGFWTNPYTGKMPPHLACWTGDYLRRILARQAQRRDDLRKAKRNRQFGR